MSFAMIIIPFGHDDLVVERLPFVTIGIILICFVVYFPTTGRMENDTERQRAALEQLDRFRLTRDYIKLPDEMLARLPKDLVERHNTYQEWVKWYLESPQEVDAYLQERSEERGGAKRPGGPDVEGLLSMIEKMPGGENQSRSLEKTKKELGVGADNEMKKELLLSRLQAIGPIGLEEEQAEFARLYIKYVDVKADSILGRLAYVPSRPSLLALITHQFLHGDIFHLLFNLVFLWVAAVKLEDIWTRGVFLAMYIVCGIAGGIAHGIAHPDSTVPLIGASGAVAGLMGAFLVRLTKTQISFFYLYFFIRFTPRVGTFKAPAYLMLPLWFAGELFSALFFDIFVIAYWAHVGGFVVGVGIAIVFKLTQFEQRVLGREPEARIDPDTLPLVAFRQASEPQLTEAPAQPISDSTDVASLPAATPAPKTNTRLNIRDLVDVRVSAAGLEGRAQGSMSVKLGADDVAFIAPGRVDNVDPALAREVFSTGSFPDAPVLVLALAGPIMSGPHQDTLGGYLIDASRLNYDNLIRVTYPSRHKSFAAFAKLIIGLYPDAKYVTGMGPVAEHNVPIYADFEEFFRQMKKCAGE
ncbi:MAG: rhomboid family intramembrane serine protease [Deltaproteobacteria bacterium]|nr:rhomboid family intramembrane serine protease [Deltaproteobacteria bacterium]